MDVSKAHLERHSEQEFVNRFGMQVDSGAGLIHVRATEVLRATLAVRKAVITDNGDYNEWDIVSGMRKFNADNIYNHALNGDGNADIAAQFLIPLSTLRDRASQSDQMYVYVYVNPQHFMENNPFMAQLVQMYSQMLPASNVCVVMITPDAPLPESIGHNVMSVPFLTPGLGELRDALDTIISSVTSEFEKGVSISDEEKDRICYVGAGMSKQQFEAFASLSIVEAGRAGKKTLKAEDVIEGVNQGKTDVVNSSDILELYQPESIDRIGGMENLKDWVRKRARCYGDDAKARGIEPPKGMVFVGPPGTGKSLAAKAVSSVLGVPLVRLDFGRIFNALVGSSEQRIRSALRQVESMSPCVLFCDEIDKGLGGIMGGSSGDSGVSMRVLGSFLTWLQDSTYPVFTMVTANNIDGLPPELLRRGRFDAIFATSLPSTSDRREVLRIHLEKRGYKIDDYAEEDIAKVIDASNEYVPAEIESAIKDGLIDAFDADEDFSMDHVHAALSNMTPLSRAFKDKIAAMGEWAKTNATPASMTEEDRKRFATEQKNRIRVSRRPRK